mmetsp:Transcript_21053/g.83958  ORF Transcript_21053/g.83958 Transcript_21053/m.83958 type:complete len:238 (-) Transcript_21053:1072-1785(-)
MSSSLREKILTEPSRRTCTPARWPSYLRSARSARRLLEEADDVGEGRPPLVVVVLLLLFCAGAVLLLFVSMVRSAAAIDVVGAASMGCGGTPGASAQVVSSAWRGSSEINATTTARASGRRAYARRANATHVACASFGLLFGGPPSPQTARAAAGTTDASSEMPHVMWAAQVRTSHLSWRGVARRNSAVSLAALRVSAPGPAFLGSPRPRSSSRTPRRPSGAVFCFAEEDDDAKKSV